MKAIVLVLALLALLLAGCENLPPPPATRTPLPATATPMPTPTREDEVVIPFETIAVNQMESRLPDVVGDSAIVTEFSTVSHADDADNLPWEPLVFLVHAPEDVTPFASWLPPEILSAIANVDFQEYAVFAYFAGIKSGGLDGYIARIAARDDGTLVVYAPLRLFSSGAPIDTVPGHIVKIRRQDVPFALPENELVQLETYKVIVE